MTEKMTTKLDFRITESQKEEVLDYCKKANIKPSNFIRGLVLNKIKSDNEENR